MFLLGFQIVDDYSSDEHKYIVECVMPDGSYASEEVFEKFMRNAQMPAPVVADARASHAPHSTSALPAAPPRRRHDLHRREGHLPAPRLEGRRGLHAVPDGVRRPDLRDLLPLRAPAGLQEAATTTRLQPPLPMLLMSGAVLRLGSSIITPLPLT